MEFREPNYEDMKIYYKEGWVHLCGILYPPRPGVRLFYTILEYKYFPPATEKNEDFIILELDWQKMIWLISSIPKEYMPQAKVVANVVGLEIKHTIPIILLSDELVIAVASLGLSKIDTFMKEVKKEVFPLKTPTIYTLENAKGHKAYNLKADNPMADMRELIKKEGELCKCVENGETVDLDEIKTHWKHIK